MQAEQNAAWQSFADKTRAYAGDLARERARGMRTSYANPATTNGLQHLGQAVDAAQNRLAALQEVESAARVLYQAFSPEQKVLADMRIPTIIAPRPVGPPAGGTGANLPDMESNSRQLR